MIRFLLDQGLPRSTAVLLRAEGWDAVHVGERGMASASDISILELAVGERRVVVTLDADFHAILALADAHGPSVVRIRHEGLKGTQVVTLLKSVVRKAAEALSAGAMITVAENRVRVKRLPLVR